MSNVTEKRDSRRSLPLEDSARIPDLEWDLVDETSLQSFPASDPPGWISRRRAIESVRVSIGRERHF
jgi:hypothetical protein